MDNRDGTLSLFNTVIDHAAPVDAPAPGTAANLITEFGFPALARALSANDPQGLGPRGPGTRLNEGRGKASDRNVELPLRDPRKIGQSEKG
jgi:hypothetical protein